MARLAPHTLLLALLVFLFGSCTAQNCTTNNLQVTYPAPVAADGWEYRLISTGLTAPRSIVFDSTGGLLVLDDHFTVGPRPVGQHHDRLLQGLAAPAQIALAWLLQTSPAMLPIPGTSKVEHLEENLARTDIVLSDEEMRTLDALES